MQQILAASCGCCCLGFGRDVGGGPVPRGADECVELQVGYRRAIDPEAIDRDAMDRRLFGIVPIGTHAEYAAGDQNHIPASETERRLTHRPFLDTPSSWSPRFGADASSTAVIEFATGSPSGMQLIGGQRPFFDP